MSILAMNLTIKNNRKLLLKRDKFKNTLRLRTSKCEEKTEYNLPKATNKQLRAIRKRMKMERQIWWVKITVITLIGFLGLIVSLIVLTKS